MKGEYGMIRFGSGDQFVGQNLMLYQKSQGKFVRNTEVKATKIKPKYLHLCTYWKMLKLRPQKNLRTL